MFKLITLYYLLIWMTVSQVALCQEERFSFIHPEDNTLKPLYGKFHELPPIPNMLPLNNGKKLLVARTEITVHQYRFFCESTNRNLPEKTPSWGWHENHPMVYISFKDAKDYCEWLSKKTGENYRLPTIKEWEEIAEESTVVVKQVAWFNQNSPNYSTNTVATKSPNNIGIYDMQGNVWEWCLPTKRNGKAPIKGGSWNRSQSTLSIKNTEWIPSKTKAIDIGFRPVLEIK